MKRNLLREKRMESGYKIKKVTRDLKISRTTLYRKEYGQVPLKHEDFKMFSNYYGVDIELLKKHYDVR